MQDFMNAVEMRLYVDKLHAQRILPRRGDVRGGIMWPNAGCMFLPCMHENAAGLRFHQNAVKYKMMRQMPDALKIC